jgi:hypothetical protein
MNFTAIRKAFTSKIVKALDATHGALFSAADLSDAMKTYKHAQAGEHYHPDLGVYGTFDPSNENGSEIIAAAKQKLLGAKAAYDRTFGDDAAMLNSDDVLNDEFGMRI